MSEQNVDAMRQALLSVDPTGRFHFDILDQEVQAALLALWHEDVEFDEDPRFPEARVYQGRAAVSAYFDSFKSLFEKFDFEVEEIVDAREDRVLLLVTEYVRGLGSGVDTQMQSGWVMTIRDGVVSHVRPYVDREEALEAVGLRGQGG